MNWLADFVAIARPAGIISGIVGHALNRWSERSNAKVQARYLALRVAITLERFAGDCLNLISEIDAGVELNADLPPCRPTSPS